MILERLVMFSDGLLMLQKVLGMLLKGYLMPQKTL